MTKNKSFILPLSQWKGKPFTDMIKVTRLNGKELAVNVDLIKFVESTPDTLLTLATGDKLMVVEPVDEVIEKLIQFKRLIHSTVIRALEI